MGSPVRNRAHTPGEVQELYVGVFGQSSRAIIASLTAYLIAQLFDVRAFHFWKRLRAGRHMWLRNNPSTVASQLLDSILVITVLFYDVLSFEAIVQTIVASYVFKVLFALIDTPLIYLGVHLLGPHVGEAATESAPESGV